MKRGWRGDVKGEKGEVAQKKGGERFVFFFLGGGGSGPSGPRGGSGSGSSAGLAEITETHSNDDNHRNPGATMGCTELGLI